MLSPGQFISPSKGIVKRNTSSPLNQAFGRHPSKLSGLQSSSTKALTNPSQSIPYLSRIQQSFGPGYDLRNIKSHSGTESQQVSHSLGTRAFTRGNHIVFGDRPNLHVAAHEAAHVFQQQAGLQFYSRAPGGKDVYEQNANAIADRVVNNQSAADLLPPSSKLKNTTHLGDSLAPSAQAPLQKYTEVTGEVYNRLADDGKMAVVDHGLEAWALPSKITDSNKVLADQHSKAKIEKLSGKDVTVKAPTGGSNVTLSKFRMIDSVTGTELETQDDCGGACQQNLGAEYYGNETFVASNKRGTTDEFTAPSTYRADDLAPGGDLSTTEDLSGEIYIRIFAREFNKTLNRVDALKAWDALSASEKERLSKKYGINDFAVPKMGQSVTISSERDMPGSTGIGYNFHFGYNLMASGEDYLTLEDYHNSGKKYYFDMYGPASKKQAWNQEKSNTDAVDYRWSSMVVQHADSIQGEVNDKGVLLEDDPAVITGKKVLPKGTKVKLLRQGNSWSKVEVTEGSDKGKSGWIMNKFFTHN